MDGVLISPFSNSITIATEDVSLATLQTLNFFAAANDAQYGATANTVVEFNTRVNITDPCANTSLELLIETETFYFASNNYTERYLNLEGSAENVVGQNYTRPDFCGPF